MQLFLLILIFVWIIGGAILWLWADMYVETNDFENFYLRYKLLCIFICGPLIWMGYIMKASSDPLENMLQKFYDIIPRKEEK